MLVKFKLDFIPRTLLTLMLASALALFSGIATASEAPITHSTGDTSLDWGACPAFFPAGCHIAVLHGSPDKPNVDVFFKVPGHYDFPWHTHTSAERMILISGELDVTYEGHEQVSLKSGMYAYGPAAAVHTASCISDEPCILFIAFEKPLDAMESARPAP